MADHDHSHSVKPYFVVFGILLFFTAASFLAYETMSKIASFYVILLIAFAKAAFVVIYFMHLNSDWRKVYFLIFPTVIMGTLLVVVLLPDIVLAWHAGE